MISRRDAWLLVLFFRDHRGSTSLFCNDRSALCVNFFGQRRPEGYTHDDRVAEPGPKNPAKLTHLKVKMHEKGIELKRRTKSIYLDRVLG